MKKIDKPDFFDKAENVSLMLRIFYGCCALLVVLDFVIDRYTYHPLESIWGFYPIYGFIGCVVLVIIAKWMRLFLMRDEDYYDVEEEKKLALMQMEKESDHVGD
tara:strand:- start:3617 stop:3928 length:312 start_codon:yes stop_codon:yes gene_type:complete